MKACFMGLGYIGLPTAIIAAKHGVQVIGVDINPKVVELTNKGKLHIIEPGMEEMLQEVIRIGAFKASTSPEVSDAYFMVVPTPFKGNHEPISHMLKLQLVQYCLYLRKEISMLLNQLHLWVLQIRCVILFLQNVLN